MQSEKSPSQDEVEQQVVEIYPWFPSIIKMESGEMIVGEVNYKRDELGMIVIMNPIVIVPQKQGFALYPWAPFSSINKPVVINTKSIQYMGSVDKPILKAYGNTLMSIMMTTLRNLTAERLLHKEVPANFIKAVQAEAITIAQIMNMKYGVNVDFEEIASEVYEFILENTSKPKVIQ
jgi:hypothetical protein